MPCQSLFFSQTPMRAAEMHSWRLGWRSTTGMGGTGGVQVMGSEHQHTSGRAQGDPAGCSCRVTLGLSEWAWTGEGILIFMLA